MRLQQGREKYNEREFREGGLGAEGAYVWLREGGLAFLVSKVQLSA